MQSQLEVANQPTKYTVANDGTSLAYRVFGNGTPLILTNGYATSSFYWHPLVERLKHHYQIITWDLKGHGNSAPARCMAEASVQACANDLQQIMNAVGIERCVLLGFSFGCQIVFEAWRQYADRINAIVPILGPYGKPFDNLFDPQMGKLVFRLFRSIGPEKATLLLRAGALSGRLPGAQQVVQKLGVACNTLPDNAMQPFFKHLGQIDGPTWYAMGVSAQNHCASKILPTISVPSLIISGGRDTFAPPRLSTYMKQTINGAKHLHIDDATHTGLLGYTDIIGDALESFLSDLPTSSSTDRQESTHI